MQDRATPRRRLTFRRLRQGFVFSVFLGVAFWGLKTYLADHRTFAWDSEVSIAVVGLLDKDRSNDRFEEMTFIRRFFSSSGPARRNLREVEGWLTAEFARHVGEKREILDIITRGPLLLEEPPPLLPESDASFWERFVKTRAFISYFDELTERDELLLGEYDLTVFVYFYDHGDEQRRRVFAGFDSLASRRNSYGIVFAPVSSDLLGHTCAVVAHEICHLLGATDKYDERGSVFPDGFAEPDRQPRFPQRRAEIMALGIPLGGGAERPVTGLEDCVVGEKTAEQMNWRRRD